MWIWRLWFSVMTAPSLLIWHHNAWCCVFSSSFCIDFPKDVECTTGLVWVLTKGYAKFWGIISFRHPTGCGHYVLCRPRSVVAKPVTHVRLKSKFCIVLLFWLPGSLSMASRQGAREQVSPAECAWLGFFCKPNLSTFLSLHLSWHCHPSVFSVMQRGNHCMCTISTPVTTPRHANSFFPAALNLI